MDGVKEDKASAVAPPDNNASSSASPQPAEEGGLSASSVKFDIDKNEEAKEQQPEVPEVDRAASGGSTRAKVASLGRKLSSASSRAAQKPKTMVQKIVQSHEFDTAMTVVIIVNMGFVIYEADLRATGEEPGWLWWVNALFLLIYSVEICVRLSIERWDYFKQPLNILDVTIVCFDVVANILETLFKAMGLPSVSVLRVIRAARLLRVLRASSTFRELWLMLHGMGAALKAMGWACVLICIMLLIWSVVGVEFLRTLDISDGECEALEEAEGNATGFSSCPLNEAAVAFARVDEAMFTWFLLVFAAERWPDLAVPIMRKEPATVLIFLSAYVCINLGLMNLILTVIVDRATEARFEDERQKVQDKKDEAVKAKAKLRKICREMDEDESGCLTLEEIEEGFEYNDDFHDTLQLMDIGKEDLKTVFTILDEDGSGSVTYEEFCDHLYKMKTEEAQTMLTFIKYHVEDVHIKVTEQLRMLTQDWGEAEIVGEKRTEEENMDPISGSDFGI